MQIQANCVNCLRFSSYVCLDMLRHCLIEPVTAGHWPNTSFDPLNLNVLPSSLHIILRFFMVSVPPFTVILERSCFVYQYLLRMKYQILNFIKKRIRLFHSVFYRLSFISNLHCVVSAAVGSGWWMPVMWCFTRPEGKKSAWVRSEPHSPRSRVLGGAGWGGESCCRGRAIVVVRILQVPWTVIFVMFIMSNLWCVSLLMLKSVCLWTGKNQKSFVCQIMNMTVIGWLHEVAWQYSIFFLWVQRWYSCNSAKHESLLLVPRLLYHKSVFIENSLVQYKQCKEILILYL